jgi:hypothetical protein
LLLHPLHVLNTQSNSKDNIDHCLFPLPLSCLTLSVAAVQ